jgi:hypothetical protein
MRQHGEYGLASRTLNAPNGQTAEANSGIMRVACQTAAFTGRFVGKLKTQGEDEGEDKLDIYGPARDVKGASRGKTRLGTDAVIYPTSS